MDRKISSDLLKLIALVTMVIDHVTALILQRGYLTGYIEASAGPLNMVDLALLLRGVGRLAFPLFAFLIVEGFYHTRSKKNYALRLLIFALISEIPFDFGAYGKWFDLGYQNVLFTFLIGFLTIWCMTYFEKKEDRRQQVGGIVVCLLAGMLIAYILHVDYSFAGVALIGVLYLTRNLQRPLGILLSYLAFVGAEALVLRNAEIGIVLVSLIAFLLMLGYNGQRNRKGNKWFFYIFYPAHLFVLRLIAIALFN